MIKIKMIKDMIRKDVPIYYRNLYTGVAVIEVAANSVDCRIDFAIETKPTGQKEISVTVLDTIDYPLVPTINLIKEFITELDSNGALPAL